MGLPTKLLEQIAFITRPKTEEHMFINLNKSSHEEHLSHPLQTNIKQSKISVTFLTGYNGVFHVTNSNSNCYLMKSISGEDGFFQITIPPGAYEIESLNNEIKRIIIDDGNYTESNNPIIVKPDFSTLGSIIEILLQGPIISFMFDYSIRDLLGSKARTLYEEYHISSNLVNILSFDNIFFECDIA